MDCLRAGAAARELNCPGRGVGLVVRLFPLCRWRLQRQREAGAGAAARYLNCPGGMLVWWSDYFHCAIGVCRDKGKLSSRTGQIMQRI